MDDPSRLERIESVFHGALEREGKAREEYLRAECGEDSDLRRRVEALLEGDGGASPLDQPFTASSMAPMLGRYRVLAKLGEGGMGAVYLARDTELQRDVALKILPASLTGDAERKRRLLREARAASALNHPNIVSVYDVGRQGDAGFIVMEYIRGKPLDRLIPRTGLKLEETLDYAVQIADGLASAHAAGIVHRDLKPANVLITDSGVAKVVDFGVAKQVHPEQQTATLTGEGLIVGTVAYMSPEQAEGKSVDARSDVFSFGSLLYEMVTGHRAFERDTAASTLAAVLREEPKPINASAEGVPPLLAQLIERCLRKAPAERFENMDAVNAALQAIKQDGGELRSEARRRSEAAGAGLFGCSEQ